MVVNCPVCACALSIPDDFKGKRVQCPKCGQVIYLAVKESPPEPPAPPPLPELFSKSPMPPRLWRPSSHQVLSGLAGILAVIAVGTWISSLFPKQHKLPAAQPVVATPPPPEPPRISEEDLLKQEAERRRIERLNDIADVSILSFAREFESNQLAAEQKYKGRQIRFGAVVRIVSRNDDGLPVIVFATGRDVLLRMFIDPDDVESWTDVKQGSQVFVTGVLHSANPSVITMVGWREK